MVHLADWRGELFVVMSARRVMLLNAENAWRNGNPLALTFSVSRLAPRRANWPLISHAVPPLNARYSENSESAGSMAAIVRPAVRTSTPAIFLPCHDASALRLPRK